MNFKQQHEIINAESEICPHLALIDDNESYAAFPSSINACYRGTNPTTPKFSHQRGCCLSPNYGNCSIYNSTEIKKFPKEMRFKSQGFIATIKPFLLPGIFAILIVMVILRIAFGGEWKNKIGLDSISQSSMINSTTISEENPSSSTSTDQIGDVESKTTALYPEKLLTKSPEIESTVKPDPILALDTPIGRDQKFIIHRVIEGESLQYLADRYYTSPQAILAVNDDLILPLWIGWIVVIPMDTTDVEGLPSFSAYQIDNEGITLERFAAQLDASAEQLSLYNNIDEEHVLHQGEWLIIPRN